VNAEDGLGITTAGLRARDLWAEVCSIEEKYQVRSALLRCRRQFGAIDADVVMTGSTELNLLSEIARQPCKTKTRRSE
jgi:hypothetical protein